jgi:hypothetical protein
LDSFLEAYQSAEALWYAEVPSYDYQILPVDKDTSFSAKVCSYDALNRLTTSNFPVDTDIVYSYDTRVKLPSDDFGKPQDRRCAASS